MDNIVIQMIILLLLVVAGFVSNRCGLMGGDFDRKLSGFIINVSCPCIIISSVMGDVFPDRGMILPLLGVGMITYVLLFLIAYFLPRYFVRKADYRGMYSFMLMFANVGFIGYPVVASIFGSQAVFYASLLNIPNTLFIFIVGLSFVLGSTDGHKFNVSTLYCPPMVASYVSIVIVALGLDSIPRVVSEPFSSFGRHHRSGCVACYRFFDGPDGYPPYTRHKVGLCHVGLPSLDNPCGHIFPVAPLRSRRDNQPHQHRAYWHAGGLLWHDVLPEIRAR